MKLRNKKTGEIRNAVDIDMYTDSVYLKVSDGEFDNETIEYRSLAELNEEWEDVPEEPEEYWGISSFGDVEEVSIAFSEEMTDEMREIGNYFSSREEAEKAVEKLKAWKRLKDKGISFGMRRHSHYGGEMFWQCPNGSGISDKQIWRDLDLLFGGEE